MDRLQVIAALQKWIETRRQEVAFIEKHRHILDGRHAHECTVRGARANLAGAMKQAMTARSSKEQDKPFRITIPDEKILIEMQPGADEFTCSRLDITFPAKPAT